MVYYRPFKNLDLTTLLIYKEYEKICKTILPFCPDRSGN